jgi:hypothetical protein
MRLRIAPGPLGPCNRSCAEVREVRVPASSARWNTQAASAGQGAYRGAPGRNRTSDTQFRKPVAFSSEADTGLKYFAEEVVETADVRAIERWA